jgi:hypothetical protein
VIVSAGESSIVARVHPVRISLMLVCAEGFVRVSLEVWVETATREQPSGRALEPSLALAFRVGVRGFVGGDLGFAGLSGVGEVHRQVVERRGQVREVGGGIGPRQAATLQELKAES